VVLVPLFGFMTTQHTFFYHHHHHHHPHLTASIPGQPGKVGTGMATIRDFCAAKDVESAMSKPEL